MPRIKKPCRYCGVLSANGQCKPCYFQHRATPKSSNRKFAVGVRASLMNRRTPRHVDEIPVNWEWIIAETTQASFSGGFDD